MLKEVVVELRVKGTTIYPAYKLPSLMPGGLVDQEVAYSNCDGYGGSSLLEFLLSQWDALRDLLERFLLVKEVAADRRAVARTSTPALAGALHEVASTPSLAVVGAGDLAAARIERLFAPQAPLPPVFHRAHVLLSALGLAALTLSIVFPARLDLHESAHLRAMLTSVSLHGLPGMAAGLALNGLMLSAFALAYRRLAIRHSA